MNGNILDYCAAEKKIQKGLDILNHLNDINIDGINKLKSKIKQEINFLQKRVSKKALKKEHLVCSNLTHLEAVASKLLQLQNVCISVMCNKTLNFEEGHFRKICIDLILCGGTVWMKVIARNQRAITLVSSGEGSFGQKSILDQAYEFVKCSKQNVYYFKPPTVIFFFANGIEKCVEKELNEIGVQIENNKAKNNEAVLDLKFFNEVIIEYPVKDLEMIRNLSIIKQMPVQKLNLGVTTLIAYVSALTNGGFHYNFESEILKKHAEWEKARPVKPILDKLFEGRKLYCCKTAVRNFQNILEILGGKSEKERGEKLLKQITIVEDKPTIKLKVNGKIKERSLAIFGTGEYLKAVTVTANHAFIRSAKNQGVYFSVFLHESRALTEGKQLLT